MSSPSRWWYGVVPFPLVVLTALLSRFAVHRFIKLSTSGSGESDSVAAIASFLLSSFADLVGLSVALFVLVCLVLDVRALRRDSAWSPSWAWGLAGVVHLVGTMFTTLLVVSVPALSVYLYRRRGQVGLR
ncbi:hypothetical protein ELS19_14065 [Halogeometricum borinquense]|uniref:Uncharacterized protein n=1 Tax=Halogeometricum borinquense TaxID=60847 RepID=A0A482TPX5_9EURY|nr:hypothetical protein [Halogeometricum borinquense]RYJ14965.1 hypothetical protein ELS19_14065 [Halogeometricum borinquense]